MASAAAAAAVEPARAQAAPAAASAPAAEVQPPAAGASRADVAPARCLRRLSWLHSTEADAAAAAAEVLHFTVLLDVVDTAPAAKPVPLADGGISVPLLVLKVSDRTEDGKVCRARLTCTGNALDDATALANASFEQRRPIALHVQAVWRKSKKTLHTKTAGAVREAPADDARAAELLDWHAAKPPVKQ